MWARFGVAEKRADLIRSPWREDMFEFAGLLFDFGLAVHREAIGKQPFSQAVTTDNTAGLVLATGRE